MASREDIKLLSTISQHYRPAGVAETPAVAETPIVAADAPPSYDDAGASTVFGGDSATSSGTSAAQTALLTGTALLGVAAVAGICAARGLQFRVKYDREHVQCVDFTGAAIDEEDKGETSAISGQIPLHCINMPAAHVEELSTLFANLQLQNGAAAAATLANQQQQKVIVPVRTPLTLFDNAGSLCRGGGSKGDSSAAGGGQDGGGSGGGASDFASGGGGGDEFGGATGGRLGNIQRGKPLVGRGGAAGGGKFVGDCKQSVLEAYARLLSKQNNIKEKEKKNKQIPCLSEHFIVLVNNNEPDIFFTITEIAKRFKGQRITLVHCLALTVDGTNTKTFSNAVSGTVTDEWLSTITGELKAKMGEEDSKTTENNKKKTSAGDSSDDDDDDSLDDALRRVPLEVLFQPTAGSFVPTTRQDSNAKLLKRFAPPSCDSTTAESTAQVNTAAAAIPTLVHTSNALDFALYNNKAGLEGGSITGSAGKKKASASIFGALFPNQHQAERRAVMEALFKAHVPTSNRSSSSSAVVKPMTTDNGDETSAASAAGASPLFSPRLVNYLRLATFLQYGAQSDPEHYPLLSALAKLSGGLVVNSDAVDGGAGALSEDSIDADKLFKLSAAATDAMVGGGNGAFGGAVSPPSAANSPPASAPLAATPQARTMLTPVDLKALRLWIEREWALTSSAWVAVRTNSTSNTIIGGGGRSSGSGYASTVMNIRDTLLYNKSNAATAASAAFLVNALNTVARAHCARHDAHLHAVYLNAITVALDKCSSGVVVGDEEEEAEKKKAHFTRWLTANFASLAAQSIIVAASSSAPSTSSLLTIQYNTIGHVGDATAAVVEQCRLLALSGVAVVGCTVSVAIRQGALDFTKVYTAAPLGKEDTDASVLKRSSSYRCPFIIAPSSSGISNSGGKAIVNLNDYRKISLESVAAAVAAAELEATSANANGSNGSVCNNTKFNAARVRKDALRALETFVARNGCNGGEVGIVSIVTPLDSDAVSAASSPLKTPVVNAALAGTCTAPGNDLRFAQMAAKYVAEHHPALTSSHHSSAKMGRASVVNNKKKGLVPLSDADAADRSVCPANGAFIHATYTNELSSSKVVETSFGVGLSSAEKQWAADGEDSVVSVSYRIFAVTFVV